MKLSFGFPQEFAKSVAFMYGYEAFVREGGKGKEVWLNREWSVKVPGVKFILLLLLPVKIASLQFNSIQTYEKQTELCSFYITYVKKTLAKKETCHTVESLQRCV